MADFGIYAGDTNKTVYLRLRDSITGLAKTGLVFNSAGAVCSYVLPLAARVAITLATQTVTGAHSDGGFVEIDATNAKGLYRLDLPDAAIASGDFTIISIEFDGVIEESLEIPLHIRHVNTVELGGTTQTGNDVGLDVDTLITQIGTAGDGLTNINLPDQTMDITGNLSGSVGSVTGAVGSVTGSVGSVVGHTNQTADHTANIASILTDTGTTLDNHLTDIKGTGFAKDTHSLTDVTADVTGLNGDVMRGTDNAALASIATEARLAELDAANLPADVDTLLSRITSTLFSGMTSLGEWLGLLGGKQAGDATALTEIKATGAGSGTYDPTTDSHEALRDTAPMGTAMRGTDNAATAANLATAQADLDTITGADGVNLLSATQASIDAIEADTNELQTDWVDTGRLDTILDARASQTTVDAIETDTQDIQSRLPAALVGGRIDATIDGTGMEAGAIDAILQRQITEAYNVDGTAPTVEQALMGIMQCLTEFAVTGTTITVKKLDGSTAAMTYTLDSATEPTSRTRAT